ncbi:hypothetical protein FUT69_00920 [Xylella taiwanensis]|uniref:Uncharacterized protein n=2 Tax=Xylella taiwanensis TaxID=1444770 RepID=A0ABS8TTN0_9GAMM|nr:hypothetical protein [Xylella taiwanensis]MCD8458539.1 hypothetical protein [Xylella taiwanensis]MCD8460674.1 hypothetical protein [Xylella taiwanensis]MCD8463264.1 hypothetical protein [Xylella taiwanensis]MCD8465179.1 hypothetical protein [Xylella taiwanensis]MCD8467260.1 hypothetical protein [Xylella taiwanensis]
MRELNQVEVEQVSGACLNTFFSNLLSGLSGLFSSSTVSTDPTTSSLAASASSFLTNFLSAFLKR